MVNRMVPTEQGWRLRAGALLAAMGMLAAACGGSDSEGAAEDSGDADSSESSGDSEKSSGGVSDADMATIKAEVAAAQEVPEWVAQGPAFSVADLAGKKILAMPVASSLEGCDNMARWIVDIAKEVGMTDSVYFQNDGGPAAWAQGMELALNQNFDGVALVCGIPPEALGPQMTQADEAGMLVVDLHLADVSEPANEMIAGQTNGEFNRAMRMGVYQSLIASGGEPIDVFIVTANENPPSIGMEATVISEYARLCSACNVTSANVPIPEWGTKGASTVASALVANPNVKAVFTVYDFMGPVAVSEIKAAGSDASVYAFGGDKPVVSLMAQADSHIGSDMGPNFLWMANSGADQLFRVLVGEPAIPAAEAFAPYRMWTPENASEQENVGDGFGDAFEAGYRSLWLDLP